MSVFANPHMEVVAPRLSRVTAVIQGMENGVAPAFHVVGRSATDNRHDRPFLLLSTHKIHHQEGDVITWARFDDNYDSNPKIIAAGRFGRLLHETSIRWCCRLRTNGLIPKAALAQLGVLAQLPGSKTVQNKTAQTLVGLNLWEDHGEQWRVHDFEEFSPPQRFVNPTVRITKNHAARDKTPVDNHGSRDPDPTRPQPVPVVSLKDLQEKAVGRGVAPDTVSDRLAGLQQLAEGKGAKHWIPYVTKGYQGQACLFDQHVVRWLEEDHHARKEAEREIPPWLNLHKPMDVA